MSPLARSLLALAALLAVADAQGYNCVPLLIGQETSVTVNIGPFDADYGPNDVQVNNYCQYPTPNHVGELVVVCNKVVGYPPAVITAPSYPLLTPVHIECYDPDKCNVNILEYCA